MASLKSIFGTLLGVKNTVIENVQLRSDSDGLPCLELAVRPTSRHRNRCPICGRTCPGYDTRTSLKRWRTIDFCGHRAVLLGKTHRVVCPEHGVVTAAVPWAARDSGFTHCMDQMITWLVTQLSRKAVSELMRVDWKSVGRAVSRQRAALEPDISSRFNGLRYIGIDETSYRKGHKYVTVVVNHETKTVVWVGQRHGKSVLEEFFKLLTPQQRESIEIVTGDGARWITDCAREYCPNCRRCVDTFHVVEWAQETVDTVRREAWRRATNVVRDLEEDINKKDSKSDKDASATEQTRVAKAVASAIKGSRYALGKAPENLTSNQNLKLEMIQKSDKQLYRAYLRKEELRLLLKLDDVDEAKEALKQWLNKACHSKVKAVVELSRKIRRHKEHILNTIRYKMNNARVEAINSKIKLLVKRSYGFRNIENLKDLILLVCSNLPIRLPFRDDANAQAAEFLAGQGVSACPG